MNQLPTIAPPQEPDLLPPLFVGSIDGALSCASDDTIYEILPKLLAITVLQGAQHFCIDGKHFVLDAGDGQDNHPVSLLLNITRPAKLQFFNESAVPLRKVQISAPAAWLGHFSRSADKNLPALEKFRSRHLTSRRLVPSAEMVRLAEQVIQPPPHMQGEFSALYRQSKGLELLLSACSVLLSAKDDQALHLSQKKKAEEIRDFLLLNLGEDIAMATLSRAVGASASSVQRYFKATFGQTISDFVRAKRLERASIALQNDGITIAQAAHLAGYSSPAHFSTAFKRTYGIVPSARRR